MKNIIIKIFIGFIIWFSSVNLFCQDYDRILNVFKNKNHYSNKYDFSKIATNVHVNVKIDFLVDEVIGKIPESIHFYTKLDDYKDLIEIKNNYDELYKYIDTSLLIRDLHFIDLDDDGDLDCIYDRLDYKDDNLQFINVYLNENGKYIDKKINGYYITNFLKLNDGFIIETFSWPCCDFPFHVYQINNFKNNELIENIVIYIPNKLYLQDERTVKSEFTKRLDLSINLDCDNGEIDYLYQEPFYIKEDGDLKVLDVIEDKDKICYLICTEFNQMTSQGIKNYIGKPEKENETHKLIGWVTILK